jgi:hypothetical protein
MNTFKARLDNEVSKAICANIEEEMKIRAGKTEKPKKK